MAEWGRIVSLRNASERLLADPKADLGHSLSQRPILADSSRSHEVALPFRPIRRGLWFLKTSPTAETLGSLPLLSRYQQSVRVQLTPIVVSHCTVLKTPGVISIRLRSVFSTDEHGRNVPRPEASFGIARNLPTARERP